MRRWWGIRHVRYWLLRRRLDRWTAMMYDHGIGLGCPNTWDLDYLDAVWRGEV